MLRVSIRTTALAMLFALGTGAAGAQTSQDAMGAATMPPKAPTFPVPAKPDFSSMRFLLGTWKCVSHSERRGAETTKSTATTTLSPDGYSMKTVTTQMKVSYAAVAPTTTDWLTYDSDAKRWVDVSTGSYGAYGFATSTGWSNSHLLWGTEGFVPNGDVTSATGTLLTKISDTKYTFGSAFTTTAGLVNRVTGTCTKS